VPINYSYPRYLEAKRSVDDRALNQGVLQSLRDAIAAKSDAAKSDAAKSDAPLRILEIGGGTGSMARRLVAWGVLDKAHYTLVDSDADSLAAIPTEPLAGLVLRPIHSDISKFLESCDEQFDLVIAHAVLDLIDLDKFLPLLWKCCAKGARYWFTINFDGESVFMPELPEDEAIWHAYHQSMNRRPGSCHAGRKLFAQLANSGARIEASGSSDWVVHASGAVYPHDEAYFLHHIVHTVDNELRGAPPLAATAFAAWVATRHAQIDAADLVYIAHQLDFVGTCP
tara:strand:- start:524 stop:1372 length:849 start_codon:yes stop_codon:yes gene_type:complete